MDWTDKPTQHGWHWYWNRNEEALGYKEPTPIRVVEPLYTDVLHADFPGYSQIIEIKAHEGVYWAGPIVAPPPEPVPTGATPNA